MRAFALLAALMAAAPGAAYAARVVDYAVDEATWKAWADEQLLATPKPIPLAPKAVGVSYAPGLDHVVLRVGEYCSGWTVENPVSGLLKSMFAGWNGSERTLTIKTARTLSRCVEIAEYKSRCLTRSTLEAELSQPGAPPQPIRVELERSGRGVGVCAGLTRGIALVSREAATELADKVTAAVREAAGPPPAVAAVGSVAAK